MTIELTGENLIGGTGCRGTGPEFRGFDPARQMHDQLVYASATAIDVSRACGLAAAAAGPFAAVCRADRAKFLDAVAGSLLAAEAQIVPVRSAKAGCPKRV